MGFLDDTPNLDTKLSVIETLRTVTEGKIFVEVERARVTKILSDIKKEQGDLKAATDILTELQVETFGSMDRREKTEFILAQVALCIEIGDWTQAGILSRKISTRYLARKPKKTAEQLEKEKKEREKKKERGEDVPEEKEDDTTDLKLRYYEQQIILAKHDDKYLDVCKHYRQVLDTEAVEEDSAKLHPVCLVASMMIWTIANTFRFYNESSTSLFLLPMITSSMTSSTESTVTPEILKFRRMPSSSNCSLSRSSCVGPRWPKSLVLISVALTSSTRKKVSLATRKHSSGGRTCGRELSNIMSGWWRSTTRAFKWAD